LGFSAPSALLAHSLVFPIVQMERPENAGKVAAELKKISLIAQCPSINKMDSALNNLSACE